MLVSFPIGLWVGGFVFDLLATAGVESRLSSAGFYCIIAGCVGAVFAAVPGVIDLFGTVPPRSSAKQRGYIHGTLNTIALCIFIAVAWHRGNAFALPDGLSLSLSAIGIVLIGFSGWMGGTLVYRNQIGVDHRYANASKYKERSFMDFGRPVCNQAELSDGQLMLVNIGKQRVAVGRCPDGIFAFADSCTHRGGPLSDGALIGCTVQCPWHGSQFDLTTGRVVAGPAEEHIKTYPVEIRDGEVYLRDPLVKDEKPKAA